MYDVRSYRHNVCACVRDKDKTFLFVQYKFDLVVNLLTHKTGNINAAIRECVLYSFP